MVYNSKNITPRLFIVAAAKKMIGGRGMEHIALSTQIIQKGNTMDYLGKLGATSSPMLHY